MEFRIGIKEDISDIAEVLKSSWLMHADNEASYINRSVIENSNLEEYFTDCFNGSEKSYLLLALIDKNIAGFAKVNIEEIQKFFNETKIMYIDDIYTFEQYRKRGVSSFVLKEAEKLAKEKGIKWLKARVYNFNTPAQATFKSAGFKDLYSEYFKII